MSRFEAATLLGIGFGIVAAGPIFDAIGRVGFVVNGGIYVLSFAIYRWGVAELHHEAEAEDATDERDRRPQRLDLGRYRRILGSSRVWLLAPTWIALNAVLGSWTTQSVFQLVREPPPHFEQPAADAGDQPDQREHRLRGGRVGVRGRAVVLGQPVQELCGGRRIIAIGLVGALFMLGAALVLNHSEGWPAPIQLALVVVGGGRAVRDGRRHARRAGAAGRHQRELPGRPRRDHGPLLGLPGRRVRSWARWSAGPPATWPASTACSSPAAC